MKLISSACYLFLLASLSYPIDTFANGAVGGPGLYGNEIIVADNPPMTNLVVDEEVILDYRNKTVKIDYKIINKTSQPINFSMVFPVADHRNACTSEIAKEHVKKKNISYGVELNFQASLNKSTLPSKQVFLSDLKLKGDYVRLQEIVCYSFSFPIQLQPGSNLLQISYSLIPGVSWGDGLGGGQYYSYDIWPAKNWVPFFRKALWRIILPERSKRAQEFPLGGDVKYQYDDWFTLGDDTRAFNWYKYGIDVRGPGKKTEYHDHIDIVAENFVPDGSIVINQHMHDRSRILKGCKANELEDCWQKSLQSHLSIRPYRGNQSCYDVFDLGVVLVTNPHTMGEFIILKRAIPYLRNEIFARKGHTFKSNDYRLFFEQMPWYKPDHNNVQLNAIEKWNVEFLHTLEKEIKPNNNHKNVNEMILSDTVDWEQVSQIYDKGKGCPSDLDRRR